MSEITFLGKDYVLPVTHLGLYSDNTPMVKLPEIDVQAIDTLVLRHSSTTQFVTAMFLVDSINAQGGWVKNLIMPYIPGARQDRINSTGDILFAARSFAEMVNQRKFSRVVVLDPHSPVAPSLIDRVSEYPLSEVAERMWHGYSGIIAPDKGAKERAEIFAAALNLPIYYASKNRDVSTGKLSGFSVDVPAGGHYLVVDDICDGGGTFEGLAEKIKECGAYADLYVTHGIFAKGVEGLKKHYKNIYTTDSLVQSHTVYTIPVIERMKNYV